MDRVIHGPIYLALAGLWGGAAFVSLYLLMNYSAGISLELIALYFLSVPVSFAISLYFAGKGLYFVLQTRRISLADILHERFEKRM